MTLGEKALGCLQLAALHENEHTYAEWERMYLELCTMYSAKAVDKKMEDLAERGYVDYGVSARTAWLTDKGRTALEDATT